MKKPKMKKCKDCWLVYIDPKKVFKCFDRATANFYYNFLLGAR